MPLNHAELPELRALSFFRERTSPSLSAFSKFTKQLWIEVIPQLSETISAVRHMTVALATRQELLSCSPEKLYELSAVRSQALSATIKDLTHPQCDLVAVLMCGLFFVGYECLQTPMDINPDTSVRHLGAGLRILREYHAENPTYTDSTKRIIRDYLEPMYLQMEMMFSIFNTPIHTIRDLFTIQLDAIQPRLPARFIDLQSARRAFFEIYRWHYHYRAETSRLWTPTSPAFRTVKTVYIEWYALVMAYNDQLGGTPADVLEKQNLMTVVSHSSLLMVAMVHSTVSVSTSAEMSGEAVGVTSPYLPNGGRLKTSVVDLTDPKYVTVTFIVDEDTLNLLEICDWSETGLTGDPTLRIWPVAAVRRLDDGSGRGIVRLRTG